MISNLKKITKNEQTKIELKTSKILKQNYMSLFILDKI